jgi:zinc-ribbon domain
MSDFRCPHCRTALPEKATFCAACGRRIEGWSAVPADATNAAASASSAGSDDHSADHALPEGDAATRQLEPTPSLLRAVALSRRRERQAPRWRIGLAMLVVALGGGTAAFFLVRLHRQSQPRPQTLAQTEEPPDAPPPSVTTVPVVAAPASPSPTAPKPAVAEAAVTKATAPKPPPSKAPAESPPKPTPPKQAAKPKAASPVATLPTHLAAPRVPHAKLPPGNGLPHKAVHTDSQSIAQQTVKQEKLAQAEAKRQPQLAAAAAPPPANPQSSLQMPTAAHETSEAPVGTDERAEAQASLDADGVRFVVHAHLPQVRACYGRIFKDSSPGGTVEVGFAIDANGRAKNVRTETNSTDSEPLARCLETRLKEWQFPRPVGGDFELIYPFVFAPGS